MNKTQEKIYGALEDLGTQELLDLFLNYFGLEKLDDEMEEYLVREGLLEDEDK